MYSLDEVNTSLDKEALSDALYKLERFAISQGLTELADWVKWELHGFEGCPDEIAGNAQRAYRSVAVQWRDIYNRPVAVDPSASFVSTMPVWLGVTEIESFAEKGTGYTWEGAAEILNQISNVRIVGAWLPPDQLQGLLKRIRFQARTRLHDSVPRNPERKIYYPSPDFGNLVADPELAKILAQRWNEANATYAAEAYLATIIMLGSILEGVLLAKVEANPAISNTAKSAPKDSTTNKPVRFADWKMDALINVSHECGWLKKQDKDFSHVIRDYRNFVHPKKEQQEGVTFNANLCRVVFEVVSAALSSS